MDPPPRFLPSFLHDNDIQTPLPTYIRSLAVPNHLRGESQNGCVPLSSRPRASYFQSTRGAPHPSSTLSYLSQILSFTASRPSPPSSMPVTRNFPRDTPHQPMKFSMSLSGVHSLPVELLTRIFVLGTGYDYLYTESPFLLKPDKIYDTPSSNFPLLASHVCRHWRQVALSTPSLWTTLHFREFSHIQRAEAYLSRCASQAFLLDILVDTVAPEDHTPGVTLFRDEIRVIFRMIIPHVKRWRAFHLKICDNECKIQARINLSGCGPAPNLETLQLYHFEDYGTVQNLYIATYRPPVIVFENVVPRLRNVSLIGVNLPWEKSPFLEDLHNLELALHSDNIRPPYVWWERMLRRSPELRKLSLHYSGPKIANGEADLMWSSAKEPILLDCLTELSLTDLDPEHLCSLMERLILPGVKKLLLDLPDQDFSRFVELTAGSSAYQSEEFDATASPSISSALGPFSSALQSAASDSTSSTLLGSLFPIPFRNVNKLETLVISALTCDRHACFSLLRALTGLKVFEVDFAKVPPDFHKVLSGELELEGDPTILETQNDSKEEEESQVGILRHSVETNGICSDVAKPRKEDPLLLPSLHTFKTANLSGDALIAIARHRRKRPERCRLMKWIVKWNEGRKGEDVVLDKMVEKGWWWVWEGQEKPDARRIKIEYFDDEEEEEEGDDDLEEEEVEGENGIDDEDNEDENQETDLEENKFPSETTDDPNNETSGNSDDDGEEG